jgi:organic hydroperoxide reductase OsmC/OhrA
MAENKLSFTANVVWTEGCGGELESRGLPTLGVAAPPEFHGRENVWTPEHLYTGSVASCFMLTLLALAGRGGLDLVSLSVAAESKLERVEGATHQITEVVLKPTIVVRRREDMERAEALLRKAERACFIAASIKSRVIVQPQIFHRQTPAIPCPALSGSETPHDRNQL